MSNAMTDEAIATLIPLLKSGKVIAMKAPPWTCINCGTKTVTLFKVVGKREQGITFEATCEKCGEKVYS